MFEKLISALTVGVSKKADTAGFEEEAETTNVLTYRRFGIVLYFFLTGESKIKMHLKRVRMTRYSIRTFSSSAFFFSIFLF
jgi:hypothetical protein